MLIHPTFSDFILFLYVHISRADDSYDPHELAAIKSKMKSLFPEGTDLERKLYAALREYNDLDKAKLNTVIDTSLRHFSGDATATVPNDVYADLYEIVQADGKIDQSETRTLEALKKVIDHHMAKSVS
ncbi:TerB family tellurite resistance protein [Chryseolinea lacunae]|uniref:TerB family tellurite resistance protein n=1 Tax=Chryseolinea lacunae TaxID=2801331 RepID=A0ABS1KXV1_9BACT|nr:TerB family tellurite resistance protein [Chryseolinea lacunae]MBL0744285.1 TerB family tellurite resistance protein [Chryseolinea lacunae]